MKKICVCGHFAGGNNAYDGQTIKTRSIYDELVRIYGKENVCKMYIFRLNSECNRT